MTTAGGNYSQFTHYTNNSNDPGLHVFTAAPGGVFYGGTPAQLWSVTNVYPSSDPGYTQTPIAGVGSFDGLTTNANGDLFVADGTNNKLWKIAAPVSASSTPVAVPGPTGGWRHPNGVAYDTNSKILWVVEGANGTSQGRVDKVTGYYVPTVPRFPSRTGVPRTPVLVVSAGNPASVRRGLTGRWHRWRGCSTWGAGATRRCWNCSARCTRRWPRSACPRPGSWSSTSR